jgi:CheY-like chemotaxis protein
VETSALVLLVDDIPDHMHLYDATLRARGYRVHLEATGAAALAFAARVRPDCIVIDVRIPDMTGWELCKRLKSDARLKDVPVVVLAPDLSKASAAASRGVGCAAWLMRPAVADDVAWAVTHVLAAGTSEPAGPADARLATNDCPACTSEQVFAGVRVGPVQYFACRSCGVRWRLDAKGEATA